MTLQDLHKLVDNASEETLRNCLKEILEDWFVNPEDNSVDPDKPIWPEIIMSTTGVLQDHGFYPDSEGIEGQDRENYTDDQDRANYTASDHPTISEVLNNELRIFCPRCESAFIKAQFKCDTCGETWEKSFK